MAGDITRYKMVLFGDANVGKTALVDRFINNKFETDYLSTLGYNVYEKQISYNDVIISLMIYDIAGQERFSQLRKKYSSGANTAFIIYDVTNRESFLNVVKWRNDLFAIAGQIPFIIIGNKNDLIGSRQVNKEEAINLALDLGAMNLIETSAKTGDEVESAFMELAVNSYRQYQGYSSD